MTFFLRFVAFAALGLVLLELPLYSQAFAPAACAALTTLSGWLAGYPEAVHGIRLQTSPDAFYVEVVAECLGVNTLLLFSAAVFAFPASTRQRFHALLLGLMLIALFNPLRIASLYRIGLWSPEAADWADLWLFDTAFMIGLMAIFMLWGWLRGANMPHPLTSAESKFWCSALALQVIGFGLWHKFGAVCIETIQLVHAKLLIHGISLGFTSLEPILSRQTVGGWRMPSFLQAIDGGLSQPAIPYLFIAYLLFPLISFALCQSLLGGSWRRQRQHWLSGLIVVVLWFGLGLASTTMAMQSSEAMHVADEFPNFVQPPDTQLASPALLALFYISRWLFKVFYLLSGLAGFVLWAGYAARSRYTGPIN